MPDWGKRLECCFCGRMKDKVKLFVASKVTGAFICNICVKECEKIVDEEEAYEMNEQGDRRTGSFPAQDIEPA